MDRPGKKRLSVYLNVEMHEILKKIADKRYMTITAVVKQAIHQRITWEKKYD